VIGLYASLGDNAAFTEIYTRYGHLVLGLCIKYLKSRDDAKDATLSIFSKLLEDLKKHKINHFKSWLYVYSKNFCLMELRKRQSHLKQELELNENTVVIMDFSNAEHLDEKEQQLQHLERAIATLNAEQKKCIELFYLQNKSYKEVCDLTGYDLNAVKSYIQNGKRNLKLVLENNKA
jgi:RNA polymerase sigma-70 factor (ECF subfamily)